MTARIAYVMKRYPRLSETFILYEIAGMEHLGARLELFTLLQPEPPPHHPKVTEIVAPLHHLPPSPLAKVATLLRAHARSARRDLSGYGRALWRATRYSVTSRRPFNTWKQFVRSAFIADRCATGGVTLIHAHFANTPAAVAWFANAMTGISFSITTHAKDLYLTSPAALRLVIRDCAFVATCTRYNADHLRKVVPERDRDKIHVVYHGVDPTSFAVRAADSSGSDHKPLILSVGRLVPKKGFDDLLKACRMLHEEGVPFHCMIVGEGPLRAEIAEYIERNDLSDVVTLRGAMTHADLIALYGHATLFTLSPRITANGDRDGIPNVIAEAMACSVPVVSTSVSGIPELVQNHVTGLLVAPGSPVALCDALRRLLADAPLRKRLACNAREKIEQHFNSRTTIKALHGLMDDATAPDCPPACPACQLAAE